MLVLKYVFILLPASFSAYRQRIIHPFLTRGPLDIFLIILQNIVQYMNNTGIAIYLAQMTGPCIGKYQTKVSIVICFNISRKFESFKSFKNTQYVRVPRYVAHLSGRLRSSSKLQRKPLRSPLNNRSSEATFDTSTGLCRG